MRALILAKPGPRHDALKGALRGLGLTGIDEVETLDVLMSTVIQQRPGVVILDFETLVSESEQALTSADWALHSMQLPTLIAIGRDNENERYHVELTTEFEHFIVEPFELSAVAVVMSDAVGTDTWVRSTADVPVVDADFDFSLDTDGVGYAPLQDALARSGIGDAALQNATTAFPGQGDGEPAPFEERRISDAAVQAVFRATTRPKVDVVSPPDDAATDAGGHVRATPDEPRDRVVDQSYGATPVAREAISRVSPTRPRMEAISGPPSDASTSADRQAAPRADAVAPAADEHPPSRERETVARETKRRSQEASFVSDVDPRPARTSSKASIAFAETVHAPAATSEAVSATLVLPSLTAGEFHETSPAELIFAISVNGETGRLRMAQSTLRRELLFSAGVPGQVGTANTAADMGRILGTFTWTSGTYVFVPEEVSRVTFVPYADVHELIFSGLDRHVGMNDMARHIGPHMKSYPAYTDRVGRIERISALYRVHELLLQMDGTRTFEKLMVGGGVSPEDMLRAAYFGRLTGLVAFMPEPSSTPVHMRFERTTSRSRAPSIEPPPPQPAVHVRTTPAARPSISAEDEEMLNELRATWSRMQRQKPHEIFGLGEHPSADEVSEQFFRLVREHHPDRYARAIHPEVKELADKVFLAVRNAHGTLKGGSMAERSASPTNARSQPTAENVAVAAVVSGSGQPTGAAAPRAATPPSASGPNEGSSSPNTPNRRVADVLSRLRDQRVGGSARTESFERASSGPRRTSVTGVRTSIQSLSPEQLLRSAQKALSSGANDKAGELLAMARQKGAKGAVFDAHDRYTNYLLEKADARPTLKLLGELVDEVESDVDASTILTLRGHVFRLTDENDKAQECYQKAVKKDGSNDEAARWLRHLKKRSAEDGKNKGFLDKLLNTKLTFSGKSK